MENGNHGQESQVHEFEALIFSKVDVLSAALSPLCSRGQDKLVEAINDRAQHAPSKRILSEVPGYRKAVYGPIVASRIGLEAIRGACHHFDTWLKKLESLPRGS